MGHSYLQQKILRHNYLEKENIGTYIYLEQKNTWTKLFSVKNTWTQLFRPKYTGAQLFRAKYTGS